MEFGIRELVQFGTLLASLAGAFAVVKSQLSRVIEDLAKVMRELEMLNSRLDAVEATDAVFTSKINTLTEINSVNALEKRNREIADMSARLRVAETRIEENAKMHNGTHKSVGAH